MDKMTPREVPIPDRVLSVMGLVNIDAYRNYKQLENLTAEELSHAMLKRLVNLEQLVLESQRQIEELSARLTATGTERIG